MLGVDAPLTYPAASALRAGHSSPHSPWILWSSKQIALISRPKATVENITTPPHIPAIAKALADIKHVPIETIANATSMNARRLFKLPPA